MYADTESHAKLKDAYQVVKDSEYNIFEQGCKKQDCQIVGVWDDHDFGDNNLVCDLGPDPPDDPFKKITKLQRKKALVDFLEEPTKSKVEEHDQVYAAYDFEHHGVSIRLILLDLRYNRQKPRKDGTAKIMDQTQWDWLECNLMDEGVDLHVIVSSTQVLRKDTRKAT